MSLAVVVLNNRYSDIGVTFAMSRRYLEYDEKKSLLVSVLRRLERNGLTHVKASRLARECGYVKSRHWYEFLERVLDEKEPVIMSQLKPRREDGKVTRREQVFGDLTMYYCLPHNYFEQKRLI